MIGNTIFDTKDFATRLDKEFKWDKAHKSECGWDDHDITAIAEGMLQATQILSKMQLEAYMEKKEYKEVSHAHWSYLELYSDLDGEDFSGFECSKCYSRVPSWSRDDPPDFKFCPYCGAAMDEVK